MKTTHYFIITIFVVISSVLISSSLLPSVHAQAVGTQVAPFDFQLDQSAVDGKRYSYVDSGGKPNAIIKQGQNVTLPVIILPATDKPVLVRFHATVDNNQTAPSRMPRGVHAVIEPSSVLVKPNQNATIDIVVNVDRDAHAGKYALNIVGEWEAENGFMGSSIILHIGRDFGPDAMPFNALWSPLKQYESGIDPKDISCQANFVLLIKSEDNSPACVKPTSAIALYLREWTTETPNNEIVYFMKSNSTAQIFVKYSPHNYNGAAPNGYIPLYARIYDMKTNSGFATYEINATTQPISVFQNTTTIVTYNITTQSTASGIYWLSIDTCDAIPIAVNLDNQQITSSDLQSPMSSWKCPGPSMEYKIVKVSNMTLGLVRQ